MTLRPDALTVASIFLDGFSGTVLVSSADFFTFTLYVASIDEEISQSRLNVCQFAAAFTSSSVYIGFRKHHTLLILVYVFPSSVVAYA